MMMTTMMMTPRTFTRINFQFLVFVLEPGFLDSNTTLTTTTMMVTTNDENDLMTVMTNDN